MAIRERQGRASPWQCYWNNPFTGKRESANFATKEEALKHDSLIKHRLKFERESFRKENTPENVEEDITFEHVYLLYLREKQFNKGNLSRQLYAMRKILQQIGAIKIKQLTYENLINAKEKILQSSSSSATAHKKLSILRAVMNWAYEREFCGAVRFPKLPRPMYKQFIPPTPSELATMLTAASEHVKRVILIGSQCGLRVGMCEMFKLTWNDIDMERRVLVAHGSKKNHSSQWREIPIRNEFAGILQQWYLQDKTQGIEYVIHYNRRPVQSIKKAWMKMLERAGIKRRIRPYDLRHAFATELIAGGQILEQSPNLWDIAVPIWYWRIINM